MAMGKIKITRVSPNSSVQDLGRPNALQYGISASGPMDRQAFLEAGQRLTDAAASAIEFGMLGIDLSYEGQPVELAVAGGQFTCRRNGEPFDCSKSIELSSGDEISISTGPAGNYGYLRFTAEFDVPKVMGSRATNTAASIGGLDGRNLKAGDVLELQRNDQTEHVAASSTDEIVRGENQIRVLPGLHADLLGPQVWQSLFEGSFKVSTQLDRMGVRLSDPAGRFDISNFKNIVSDAVVPGDIQILGDGTPVVLMRDHQPVGGYPRIATIIYADQDRFAQLRPNTEIVFNPVTLTSAQKLSCGDQWYA